MAEPIIRITDLVKTYDTGSVKVEALKGVSIEIPKGEMLAIMGPSGCGKTTLLNCASGIDTVTKGSVVIAGEDIHALNDNKRTAFRAKHMGFVFQFYNLLPVLNAVENVEMPLLVQGIREKEARAKALDVLGKVGLKERATHKPAQLSGGERQRVTIARSLVNDPAIVWADEPTGDLDSQTSNDVMDLMQKLNREHGQTFVIVTHDRHVGERARRIIHMKDGLVLKIEENPLA